MYDTDVFSRLLGISEPWRVSGVTVDRSERIVTVEVAYDSSTTVPCPECGAGCSRYDHQKRSWRHLDTMEFKTIVTASIPRADCREHGVHQIDVPWAEPGSHFTSLFESLVITWVRATTFAEAARQLRIGWSTVDRIMQRAVERGLQRREQCMPRHISIDETSFQRRHEYVTTVTDQETGNVIYVADGRSRESLEGFFKSLPEGAAERIETMSMDMHKAYISVVLKYVPDAHEKICFDKFHVAKYLGDAVDKVRRQEHRELLAQGDTRLTKTKYDWLRNPETMDREAWKRFEALRESSLRTAKAWTIKEHAMQLWHYTSRTWALKQWKSLIAWGERSRLEPVRAAVKTIKRHLWGVINAVVHKRTNAHAESANSRIQKVKRNACGFRNRQRFRTAIMFHCGGLDLHPTNQLA
jgi:transposase